MQVESTPATPDPSISATNKFSNGELRIMRRRSWELARQLKIAVGKERAAHTSRHAQQHLNKLIDVLALVERSLGIDAQELLQ
jgi:hypothetical protein